MAQLAQYIFIWPLSVVVSVSALSCDKTIHLEYNKKPSQYELKVHCFACSAVPGYNYFSAHL